MPSDHIPVKRLQLDQASNRLVESPVKPHFLRGPIPMDWLEKAAALPGKAINLAIAMYWLHGMNPGKPFKLTRKALDYLKLSRDAAADGLVRLEQQNLIRVSRQRGKRPVVEILSV